MSKRDAEAMRRDKQSKLDCGVIPVNKPRRMTLREFIEADLEAIRADVCVTTHVEYKHAAEHAYRAIGPDAALDRISRTHVGKLKQHLHDLGRKPATIQKTVKILASIFARAGTDGLIRQNPFAGQAKGRVQSRPKRIFQPEEVQAMLAVAPSQWWRVFIKLAVTSGLRKSELLNLHWTDIDFKAKEVRVTRKDTGTFMVREAEYPVFAWAAKTHQQRTVPVPDDVLDMLKRFRLKSGGSRYVFLSLERLQLIAEKAKAGKRRARADLTNNLCRDFQVIQRHARKWLAEQRGVKLEKVEWPIGSPHDFRRTYGTAMSRVVPIQVLCKWMGHSTVSTTQAFYLAVEERDADTGRAALAALYGAKTDAQLTRNANPGDLPSLNGTGNGVPDTMNAVCPGSSAG